MNLNWHASKGHELNFFEKNERLDRIIIDDFGMLKLEGQHQNDFKQIIDDRYHKKITHNPQPACRCRLVRGLQQCDACRGLSGQVGVQIIAL